MKKIFCVMLALAVLLSFVACGGENPAGTESKVSLSTETEASTESSESESETEPVSEQSSAPEPANPLSWWAEGLSPDKFIESNELPCSNRHSRSYIYDDAKKISCLAYGLFSKNGSDSEDFSLLLKSAEETEDLGERLFPDNFFEADSLDDTKYTIEFYEKGVSVTESLPGEGKGKSVLLSLDPGDYSAIQERIPELLSGETHFASWVTMMRRSRCTKITYYSADGSATYDFVPESASSWFWDELYPSVEGDGTSSEKTSLSGAARAEITFNNGLVYNLYFSEAELLVSASDVAKSRLYTLKFKGSNLETIENNANGRFNPPTGKPVIYLYPEKPTVCSVTLDYGEFTSTLPEYNGGWNVLARPDGKLTDLSDGKEYPYLFWDGEKYIDFDLSSGFCVPQGEIRGFLLEKLPALGLIPSEYNEFIDYWLPRMEAFPYYMITFAGKDYEEAAPLSIAPEPDSVLRVHMVFRGVTSPQNIPGQELPAFSRSGFAVIEWGGTDLNKMSR